MRRRDAREAQRGHHGQAQHTSSAPPPDGYTDASGPSMPSSGAPRGYGPEAVTSLQRDPDPARGRHATSYGQNYPRVVGWTLLGTLLPGAGLIAAGRRISGTIAIAIASLVFSAAVTFALVGDPVGLVGSMVGGIIAHVADLGTFIEFLVSILAAAVVIAAANSSRSSRA